MENRNGSGKGIASNFTAIFHFYPEKSWGTRPFRIIAVMIVTMLMGAVILTGCKPREKNDNQSSTQTAEAEKPKPTLHQIGDEVEVAEIKMVVNNFKFEKTLSASGMRTSAKGVFLVVEVTLTNVGKENYTSCGIILFSVKDQEGTEYDFTPDGMATLATRDLFNKSGGPKALTVEDCVPNVPITRVGAFDVPDDQKIYTLNFGGVLLGDTKLIELKPKAN